MEEKRLEEERQRRGVREQGKWKKGRKRGHVETEERRERQREVGGPWNLNLWVHQIDVLGGKMACGPSLRGRRYRLGLEMRIKGTVWFSTVALACVSIGRHKGGGGTGC